jgi:hypothetical protein
MRVDVDVADPLHSEARSQRLNHDTQVIKHAKAGGTARACVVVSTDWLEGAARLLLHDPVKALESGTGDHGSPFEDTWEGRHIAAAEIAVVEIIIADSPEMLLKLVLLPKPLGPNTAVVEIAIADL